MKPKIQNTLNTTREFLFYIKPFHDSYVEGGKVQNLVWDGGREVHLNNELVVRTQNIWKSNIFSRIKTPRIPLIFIEKILANHHTPGFASVRVQNYNQVIIPIRCWGRRSWGEKWRRQRKIVWLTRQGWILLYFIKTH